MSTTSAISAAIACLLLSGQVSAAPCPAAGGAVEIVLVPPFEVAASTVRLTGERVEPSCEATGPLAETYDLEVECDNRSACRFAPDALAPGLWVHRIDVTAGASAGQIQARRRLVLDRSAGSHSVLWHLFRTVATVSDLGDDPECTTCLRSALQQSAEAEAPMLIVFDRSLAGDVVLLDQLPALAASQVMLDGFDFDGLPHRRGIDAAGLPRAALRITGTSNRVAGLRLANSGGNADVLLIDGAAANGNLVESVQVQGRTGEVCERRGQTGCVLAGECSVPTRTAPNGDCGDDGIAVRDDAGRLGANRLVQVEVSGAYDKGVKISDGGVAVLERGHVHDNADGGIQATLGGTLTAVENISDRNRGTNGANGLAANGPRIDGTDPAFLSTRGNLLRGNALRGLSVRSLSHATLRDDFACGNGTDGTGSGFGLAVLDAAGFAATADARGLALVRNVDGGALAIGSSVLALGSSDSPGTNALAFNGIDSSLEGPTQIRNLSTQPVNAVGNYWERCGESYECTEVAVILGDVFTAGAAVDVVPARANARLDAPAVHAIRPSHARAGELVWIYGEGFDAVGAAAESDGCDGNGRACRGSDANCVFIDRKGAEIVAATPSMLVIRAPLTCVEPVKLIVRTRHSRGAARVQWCTAQE